MTRARGVRIALALLVILGGGARAGEAIAPRVADESVDEHFYAVLAGGIAERRHYGDRSHGPFRPFHAAPGAPIAFAAAYAVTPAPPAEPTDIPAAYWLLAAAGTALIAVSFGLASALAGEAAGLAAAAVVAAYPPLIRTTGELLGEPLGALALTGALWALVEARRSGHRSVLALGGGLLGAAALVRPDMLAAVLVCPLLLLFSPAGPRGAAIALAASGLVVGPWVAFASLRSGEVVPIVTSHAPTLMIGTHLPGDGTTQGFKRAHAAATRRRVPRLRGLGDLELPGGEVIQTVRLRHPGLPYGAALRAEARSNLRRYALGEPVAFTAMLARKAARMWRRPNQIRGRPMLAVHLLLVVVAVAGLLAGVLRTRDGGLLLVAAAVLSCTALHAVLVAHPRYALPLVPLLVAGGAAGIALARRGDQARQPSGSGWVSRSRSDSGTIWQNA